MSCLFLVNVGMFTKCFHNKGSGKIMKIYRIVSPIELLQKGNNILYVIQIQDINW